MALNLSNLNALFGLTVAAITIVATYLYTRKKKSETPKEWKPVGKISKLFIYPLKSGRRWEVETAECTEFGLQIVDSSSFQVRDRSFIVYDANGEVKTTSTFPKIVLIESSIHDRNCIKFDAPDQRTLYVKVPESENAKGVDLTLHTGEKVTVLDCGDEAGSWFSRYLLNNASELRLGYNDGSFGGDVADISDLLNPTPQTTGLYSDLTSFSLVTQASMDYLNAEAEEPVSVNQFRSNILVKGNRIEPFSEEHWDWVKIGDVVMRNVKLCTRCITATIDPETGARSETREPLKTLEKRDVLKNLAADGKVAVMGIYLGLSQAGKISVGDVVCLGKP